MTRWLILAALAIVGCGSSPNPPPRPPPSDAEPATAAPAASVPFSVVGELTEVNPYPGSAQIKNLGPALIMNAPVQKPGMTKMGKQLVAVSKVPPDKFHTDVVPLIMKELTMPPDAGLIWHFDEAGLQAVVVGAKPLASFDDIANAELRDSHYEKTVLAGTQMTRSEGTRKVVHVTFAPAAKARITQYARDHRATSVVVAHSGWAASDGGAQDDAGIEFRFAWLRDEAAAEKAAQDFVAAVTRRRPGR